MSSSDKPSVCAYSDAVLALLLDGESGDQLVQEQGWERELSAAELASHHQECPLCAATIARARRLDALLAGGTELDFDEAEADALLTRVKFAAEPELEVSSPRGRRHYSILVAACLLLLGFFAGSLFWTSEPPARALPSQPAFQTVAANPALDPGMTLLPDHSRRGSLRRMRPVSPTPNQLLSIARVTETFSSGAALLSAVPGLLRHSRNLSSLSQTILERAIRDLVNSKQPRARSAMISALATWPDGPALQSLLAQAKVRGGARVLLARNSTDPQFIMAAARLGGNELDRQLRTLVTDSPESIPVVVEALASLENRPGREALLLDFWGDLAKKSRDLDDFSIAKDWFAPLPFASGEQLREEFVTSRHASRRSHCLLAMAAQAEPSASVFLQRTVEGPRLEESAQAAFALGQMMVGEDDLHEQLDRSRRSHLLLAALAARKDPLLAPVIAQMELTEEETLFLEAGAFTPEQFTIAASLFRNRRNRAGL